MKFNAKYQLGKGLAFLGLATLTFAGCEKPDPEPTPQPNQKTEEFVYDENLSFNRPNSAQTINYTAFADTVAKLAANGAVKTIHITPKSSHMLETLNETKVLTRTNILDNIYGQSNGKLSGENTTLALGADAFQNQTVQSVLHNKLKIELEQYSK